MGWARFDDGYAVHPKLVGDLEARGLDAGGICQCARDETDGFLSDAMLLVVAAGAVKPHRIAGRLVARGRWTRDDERGGYWIHDFLAYNPSHAEAEAKRETDRQRKDSGQKTQGRGTDGRITSERNPNGIRTESERNPSKSPPVPIPNPNPVDQKLSPTAPEKPPDAPSTVAVDLEPSVPSTALVRTNGHGFPAWRAILEPRLADLDTTGTWDLLVPYIAAWDEIIDTVPTADVMDTLIALTCDYVARVIGAKLPSQDRNRIAMLVRQHGKAVLLGYSKALGATTDETPEARFRYARGCISRFIAEGEEART